MGRVGINGLAPTFWESDGKSGHQWLGPHLVGAVAGGYSRPSSQNIPAYGVGFLDSMCREYEEVSAYIPASTAAQRDASDAVRPIAMTWSCRSWIVFIPDILALQYGGTDEEKQTSSLYASLPKGREAKVEESLRWCVPCCR
jgi:hypothetical protein